MSEKISYYPPRITGIGRFLCMIGIHKWDTSRVPYYADNNLVCETYMRCSRDKCPKYTQWMFVDITIVDIPDKDMRDV